MWWASHLPGSSAVCTACVPSQVLWIEILAADPLGASDAQGWLSQNYHLLTQEMVPDELSIKDRGLQGALWGVRKQMLTVDLTLKREGPVLKQFNTSYEMRWGNVPVLRLCCWVECRSNTERLLDSLYKIYRLKSKKKWRHLLMYFP